MNKKPHIFKICFVLYMFCCWLLLAEDNEILSQVDSLISYENDFSAEYTITQYKPNQGVSTIKVAMFRRDSADKYLILTLEPEIDRGKGYLKIGNSLWLYDPVSRRFNVTNARDRFQNSSARISDFTQSSLATDYEITKQSEAQLGVYNTRVYELEAQHNKVTYPKMKIWVDENNLVRKFEDYSLSGQLLRVTAIPKYQLLSEKYVPVQIVIVDILRGDYIDNEFQNERTVITVAKPTLGAIPDLVFSQAYLERVDQ